MRLFNRAEEAAATLPKPLGQVFIDRKDESPTESEVL